jgi:hypothetical protein
MKFVSEGKQAAPLQWKNGVDEVYLENKYSPAIEWYVKLYDLIYLYVFLALRCISGCASFWFDRVSGKRLTDTCSQLYLNCKFKPSGKQDFCTECTSKASLRKSHGQILHGCKRWHSSLTLGCRSRRVCVLLFKMGSLRAKYQWRKPRVFWGRLELTSSDPRYKTEIRRVNSRIREG